MTRESSPLSSLGRLGFAAVAAQTILLRETMAAAGGSELSWGLVLAVWLIGMGAGARVASIPRADPIPAKWHPILVITLAGLGVILLRAAPQMLATAPGEVAGVLSSSWLWAAAILPASFSGGFAFPRLAAELGSGRSGSAYAAESAGALAGGLGIAVLLSFTSSIAALVLVAGLVFMAGQLRSRRILGLIVLAGCLLLASPAADLAAVWTWSLSGRPDSLAFWSESRYQRLELSAGSPASLYGDGRLLATVPDPYQTEGRAHLLMLLHRHPQHVVALGCLADASFSYFLEHPPLDTLTLIQTDPALSAHLPNWYGNETAQALDDPKVQIVHQDPVQALAVQEPADLILLLDGDPLSLRTNRTRTTEFLRSCKSRMRADSLLVLRSGIRDGYLSGSSGRFLAVLTATLRSVFSEVRAIPGEDVLLVASDADLHRLFDEDRLAERWRRRGLKSEVFVPEMLDILIDPSRVPALESHIAEASAPVNTAQTPRAVILATALAEGRASSGLLPILTRIERDPLRWLLPPAVTIVVLPLVLIRFKRAHATAIAALVGGSSMGYWIALIAAWQATRGSVFAHLGALTACFMAGLWIGAAMLRRSRAPSQALVWMLVGGGAVTALGALGTPFLAPSIVIPALLFGSGVATGSAFAGIAEIAGGNDTLKGTSVAFAAEEAGAAFCALTVGLVVLPCVGIQWAALALALFQIAAVPLAFVSSRDRGPS